MRASLFTRFSNGLFRTHVEAVMLSFPSKRSVVSFANSEANFLNLSESSQAMILKPR